TCWLGVGQVGFAPCGAHPLGNNNQFHRISPTPKVSGLPWHEQRRVRRRSATKSGMRWSVAPVGPLWLLQQDRGLVPLGFLRDGEYLEEMLQPLTQTLDVIEDL